MYKKVLFVEDEQFIAEMYADILRGEGFDVDIVPDGQQGYAKASTGEYDLVLLDLMLPSMTGLEILRRLRDNKLTPKFTKDNHVIILTNLDEDDITKKEIFDLANGYYMKVNITPHKLANILKEMNTAKQSDDAN